MCHLLQVHVDCSSGLPTPFVKTYRCDSDNGSIVKPDNYSLVTAHPKLDVWSFGVIGMSLCVYVCVRVFGVGQVVV